MEFKNRFFAWYHRKPQDAAMPRSGAFPRTSWTLVLSAGRSTDPNSAKALASLCEAYWYPLYAFIRRTGRSPEDAQDLTQAFFSRLLEKRYLERPDPGKGKFRSFLLSSLKFFLSDEADRDNAQKRGGAFTMVPIDIQRGEEVYMNEPADSETPEKIFERQWALALLTRVLERLKKELEDQGKTGLFESVKQFLINDSGSYAELAAQLGTTEGALRVSIHRLRKRYRDLVRAEIEDTVASLDEVNAEIRFLAQALHRQ